MCSVKWWTNMRVVQRFLLVGLFVCLLGTIGSLLFDYAFWPFSIVGSVFVIITFVMVVRQGLSAPVPGRDDLTKRRFGCHAFTAGDFCHVNRPRFRAALFPGNDRGSRSARAVSAIQALVACAKVTSNWIWVCCTVR